MAAAATPARKKAMNPNERRIRRAVARLVRAEVADCWKGAGHPDDYDAIEKELKAARLNFATVAREVSA